MGLEVDLGESRGQGKHRERERERERERARGTEECVEQKRKKSRMYMHMYDIHYILLFRLVLHGAPKHMHTIFIHPSNHPSMHTMYLYLKGAF